MEAKCIYVKKADGSLGELSFSHQELCNLIDDVTMSLTGISEECREPILKGLVMLVELKKVSK